MGMLVVPVVLQRHRLGGTGGANCLTSERQSLPGETRKNVPLPVSGTVFGLPGALSVTESVPLSAPEMVGVNVTVMVQLAPAFRLFPQLLVCE